MATTVVLAVVDPRAFSFLRERLSQLGVEFTIPRDLPVECRRGEIIVTDRPREVVRGSGCDVVKVGGGEEGWDEALSRVLARLSGRRVFNEIVIGIDTGERTHAMVAVGDGRVIHQSKVDEESLIQLLSGLLRTPHHRARIRIGAIPSNMDRAIELAWTITRRLGYTVELADEHMTSKAPSKRRAKGLRKDSDLHAAYLIATQSETIVHLEGGKGGAK